MGRYRKVDPKIWNDAKFRDMTDNGKLVFLFILTHPHMTSLGAMRASVEGLAAELGWTLKAFREAFREACFRSLILHDEKACFVGLPNFLKYNPPESANVVKSWRDQWDQIPECESKVQLYHRVKAFLEAFNEDFLEAYFSRIKAPDARPSLNPEHKHEHEHKHKQTAFVPPTVDEVRAFCRERKNNIDPEQFVAYYTVLNWIPKGASRQIKDWRAAVVTWEKRAAINPAKPAEHDNLEDVTIYAKQDKPAPAKPRPTPAPRPVSKPSPVVVIEENQGDAFGE